MKETLFMNAGRINTVINSRYNSSQSIFAGMKGIRLLLVFIALMMVFPYVAQAQLISDCTLGDQCMEKGKYAKAVKYYKRAIELDDDKMACLQLGKCYAQGLGVSQDNSMAANWFYYSISENNQEGLLLLRTLADERNPDALMWLGHCYQNGLWVSKNYDEAISLYKSLPNEPDYDLTELIDALERMKLYDTDSNYNKKGIDTTDGGIMDMPEYPGGMSAFMGYLQQNLVYPKRASANNITGMVIVRFVVEKDGTIEQTAIKKSVHPLLDNEALRVIQSSQKWKSGSYNGKPVRVTFECPFTFNLATSARRFR